MKTSPNPNSYKKPLLFIFIPIAVGVVWTVLFLIFLATGVISSVPPIDVSQMSPNMQAEALEAEERSKLWSSVLFLSLPAIFVIGIISILVGVFLLVKQKRR